MDDAVVIDSDQHLFETRTMWQDCCDPADRDLALGFRDDEAGNPWLTWRDQRLALADVTVPGESERVGSRLQRALAGLPPEVSYDEELEAVHWDPAARVGALERIGVDEAVVFPNYGLVWEQALSGDLRAVKANMAAWNRWARAIVEQSRGRLHPVGHLTLRDGAWLSDQLTSLSDAGVRLAMISPGLVDGRPLSHPDHDRAWSEFEDRGITPVFHVSSAGRPFDEAWYASDPHPGNPVLSSVFLWASPALALADLVLNGTFLRHPDLRVGVMELSAIWLPLFLQYLDGGYRFHRRLQGSSIVSLEQPPSHYVREHVRVAAFAYERPDRLSERSGDLFMCCSDYPHSEGTATPVRDYAELSSGRVEPRSARGLFSDNVRWLLRA